MIANEFNELFGGRYINIPFVLLLYGVIMAGYKYERYAATIPFLTRETFDEPLNYILKYFISSSLLLFIGGLYYSTLV